MLDGREILALARRASARLGGMCQADLDDATSTAVLRLVEARSRIDPDRSEDDRNGYARKVARSGVMSYLRWRHGPGRQVAADEVDVPDPSRWTSPEDRAALAEMIRVADRVVDVAVARMPPASADAFLARLALLPGSRPGAERVAVHRAADALWSAVLGAGPGAYSIDPDALLRGEAD